MCGRFNLKTNTTQVAKVLQAMDLDGDPLRPNYNVAPTQTVVGVRGTDPRQLDRFRWGLIPFWAEDSANGSRTFNARGETVASKPSFRNAFKHGRCLIPADGFYEWTGPRGIRQPHCIHRVDDELMAFAGLWETHDDFGQSCTIVTCEPNDFMAQLHNRMPVILEPESWDHWMADDSATKSLQELIAPAADGVLASYPVSPAVSSVRNNGPGLAEPLPSR